ncbi:MAG: M23 family metallopeptidase [Oscillospiraceae bacterium]|nr:M23 family metallopeptidase [Oscillospiraceae bacterium]
MDNNSKIKKAMAKSGVYIALCVGILAVGVVTAVGYRAAVGSLTETLIPDVSDTLELPDLDNYQTVDSIVTDAEKTDDAAIIEEDASAVIESADVTEELETLFYEEAKVLPISGEILNEFSWGELVKTSGSVWKIHDGIDIAAEEGTMVKSMTSGTVTDIYSDTLWGNCVVIDHGDTVIGYYCGLSDDVSVSIGDKVASGTVIGTVGNTADIESDMASHLHFALKYENAWIDPISYIEPVK